MGKPGSAINPTTVSFINGAFIRSSLGVSGMSLMALE
jgi:hypothetical protein